MTPSKSISAYRGAFLVEVSRDRIIYALIGAYMVAGLIFYALVSKANGTAFQQYFPQWVIIFFIIMPVFSVAFSISWIIHRTERRRLLAVRYMLQPRVVSRFAAGLLLLAALGVFTGTFTTVKMALPGPFGFVFDQPLADIDRALHFGVDPWIHLFRLLDPAIFLEAVEINYNVFWFVFVYGLLFWMATSPKAAPYRVRYVVCFLLVWVIIGSVLAFFFVSAGPVYFGAVAGDETRFSELVAALAESDYSKSAASYQAYLWRAYQSGVAQMGTGISAFPSVHVGIAMLNALFFFEIRRWLGYLAFAYVGVILIGSVYLGWHYAIDGYVAILVTAAIYLVARLLAIDRQEPWTVGDRGWARLNDRRASV